MSARVALKFNEQVPPEVKAILGSPEPATPEQVLELIAWTKLIPTLWPLIRNYRITKHWYKRNAATIRKTVTAHNSNVNVGDLVIPDWTYQHWKGRGRPR